MDDKETIRALQAQLKTQHELNSDLHVKNSILRAQYDLLLNQLTKFDSRLIPGAQS